MKRHSERAALVLLLSILTGEAACAEEVRPIAACVQQTTQADGAPPSNLDRAFHAMYDLDFGKADADLAQFGAEHPENPLGPTAQAASELFALFEERKILQSEFFVADDQWVSRKKEVVAEDRRREFEKTLSKAEDLANRSLGRNEPDPDALFALTMVYGLRADYAALVDRQDFTALRYSNKGNEWARKLLAGSPECYDAYVATGVQKYLVGLKPAPVRWILRIGGIKGNRDEGLQELQLTAEKGRYLAPFARILLAIAYLRKKDTAKSVELLSGLRREFPRNRLFADEIARLTHGNPAVPRKEADASGGSRGNRRLREEQP
jgi:hypothetical protein